MKLHYNRAHPGPSNPDWWGPEKREVKKVNESELEALVDSTSVQDVLNTLGDICYAKKMHIEESWQDKVTAKEWARTAGLIYNLAAKVEV